MTHTFRLLCPYTLGPENQPIAYQYENIVLRLDSSQYNITCFINQNTSLFAEAPNVRPIPIQHRNRIKKLLNKIYTASQTYDLLQTGGNPRLMSVLSRCSRLRSNDVGHVHTLHIDLDRDADPRLEYKRRLLQSADTVVAVSEHTARTAERVVGVEATVIYNGIDTTYFRPDRERTDLPPVRDSISPIFLFVGKFEPRKRPMDVLDIAERVPDATFLLRGSGSLKKQISRRAERLQNVHLLDRMSKENLARVYANVTGFVFPSVREGCPTVVLESMASGTPVIGYRATSMPELVTHGETGYLYETGDIDGLVEGVRNLCDRDRRNAMGEAAREYVIENHSFERVAREYEQIYEDVMA